MKLESPLVNNPVIIEEPFDQYQGLWEKTRADLSWHCPFMLPYWLQTVGLHLGLDGEPVIFSAVDQHRIIGLVPMLLNGDTARFLGPHHVCDYQDIIVAPGQERAVMAALLLHLKTKGIQFLDLRTLRPDALVLKALQALDGQGTWVSRAVDDEVTFEVLLPKDWDAYLMQLSGKQRHEVRRKMRRLEANGPFDFRMADGHGDLDEDTGVFLELFRSNREDKALFMDSTMEAYFKTLITQLAAHQLLQLGFLEVQEVPTAAVLCFDYQGVRYLYNSGYDKGYEELSVGILSKVFSIQNAIEKGCHTYDFLKGHEVYKGRIGGGEVPLAQHTLELR